METALVMPNKSKIQLLTYKMEKPVTENTVIINKNCQKLLTAQRFVKKPYIFLSLSISNREAKVAISSYLYPIL